MLKVLAAFAATFVILLPFLIMFACFAGFVVVVFRMRANTRAQLRQIYGYSGELPADCIWHSCRATCGRERIATSLANSKHGLFLLLTLRHFHNPEQLFVPWSELAFAERKILWFTRKRLTFRQVTGFHLDFHPKVIDELERERQKN
jgi:hypothetical protein